MKQITFILLAALGLASCSEQQAPKPTRAMLDDRQQLVEKVVAKNEQIQNFERYLKAVEINMDKIRDKENRLHRLTPQDVELHKDQLLTDLLTIADLLEENRIHIKNLEGKIHAKNGKLEEYELTVTTLKATMKQQQETLLSLQQTLTDQSIELATLHKHQDSLYASLSRLTEEKNTAWYAFGSRKEMKEQRIAGRHGGVLGIGSKPHLLKNFNRDYFSQIDIRETTSIPLYADKAQLASSHPEGSYQWNGADNIESLEITNPEEFWSTSKYLAIVVQ